MHSKQLCGQGWKLHVFVMLLILVWKTRKVSVSSEENPLSSLRNQVDLQHVNNYNRIILQVYLLLIWESLYRDLLTMKVW